VEASAVNVGERKVGDSLIHSKLHSHLLMPSAKTTPSCEYLLRCANCIRMQFGRLFVLRYGHP
jgi:hypothetical protein